MDRKPVPSAVAIECDDDVIFDEQEGELTPEFAAELQRRREAIDRGEFVVYRPGAAKQAE